MAYIRTITSLYKVLFLSLAPLSLALEFHCLSQANSVRIHYTCHHHINTALQFISHSNPYSLDGISRQNSERLHESS